MWIVVKRRMSINITYLNSLILKRLKLEETLNKQNIDLLNVLLKNENLDFEVKIKLMLIRDQLIQSNKTDIPLYVSRTHHVIQEYMDILKKPVSWNSKNSKLMKRKTELIVNFLDTLRHLVKIKNWTNLTIPQNPRSEDDVNTCPSCGNDDQSKFETDEFYRKTCLNCSTQRYAIETGITHKDYTRINVVGKFIYNRDLHFQECIRQYQGKHNCSIPEQLYVDLDRKFAAHNLVEKDQPIMNGNERNHVRYSRITRTCVYNFLKQLKYTKYYESTNLIYYVLTNKRVDDISHLEDQLMKDFKELVSLYDEMHGKDKIEELNRKNFMNVQYVLYQLLKRHNHPCNLENFTVLKTIERKQFHDEICKKLFTKLGWKFTPTF